MSTAGGRYQWIRFDGSPGGNRTYGGFVLDAGLVYRTDVQSAGDAVEGIDFNTLALLTGMMLIVAIVGGTVVLPGALLTFAHSLGEFGATVMVSGNLRLRTQTAPLYIFAQFEAGNVEGANAVAAVLALLSFVIFFILMRSGSKRERAR